MAIEAYQTKNFQVQFEVNDFSASEVLAVRSRAQYVQGHCEADYAVLCGWFGLAVGAGLGETNRVVITLTKNVRERRIRDIQLTTRR